MSIDKAREELLAATIALEAVFGAREVAAIAEYCEVAIRSHVAPARDEIARLSPAPVGGDDERIRALLGDPVDSVSVGPEGAVYHRHLGPIPPPAPVGGETVAQLVDAISRDVAENTENFERWMEANGHERTPPPAEPDTQECQTPLAACMDRCDCSVTPPPAEPDGGVAGLAAQLDRLARGWDAKTDGTPVYMFRRARDRIADLEQRLATSEAAYFVADKEAETYKAEADRAERQRDEARATIAERDRRIAELEAGLDEAADDMRRIISNIDHDIGIQLVRLDLNAAMNRTKAALLTPATDKGGE